MSALLDADVDTVELLQKARPDLWAIMSDFYLLLTVPHAIEFKEQSQKWRRAIRLISEQWHMSVTLELKFAPQAALAKLFGSKE